MFGYSQIRRLVYRKLCESSVECIAEISVLRTSKFKKVVCGIMSVKCSDAAIGRPSAKELLTFIKMVCTLNVLIHDPHPCTKFKTGFKLNII